MAKKLYKQRQWMLTSGSGDSHQLQKLEQRLRYAIAGIVISTQERQQKAKDAATAFISLASRIVSEVNNEELHEIYDEAITLLDDDGEVSKGAFDALTLYPPAQTDWMIRHYKNQASLRARLFKLWSAQGALLPSGLFNQAELQSQELELQLSALNYAANCDSYGKEIFSAYYRSLNQSSSNRVDPRLLVPAIWGALIRGDRESSMALCIAIEQVDDREVAHELLRMLALTGSEEGLPVILTYAERYPDRGYPLLALLGIPTVVEPIIRGMEKAETLQAAYMAWLMLTQVRLPQRPRLMLVDKNLQAEAEAVESYEDEMIPDVTLAVKWWESHMQQWRQSRRWFAGAPMTIESLSLAVTERIGVAVEDALALLELHLRRPLGLGRGWESHRQTKLSKLLSTSSSSLPHSEVG